MKKENVIVTALITLFMLAVAVSFIHVPSSSSSQSSSKGSFSNFGKDGIGVISIHGPIMVADDSAISRRATPASIIRQLYELQEDKRVKAIVLRINSPGGTVGASQEIFQAIERVKAKTNIPIITSIGDVGASGAYWVSLGSDVIFANPGSLIGSIGVIMSSFDLTGLGEKIGVGQNTVKSGKYKDLFSSWRDMKPEEKALLQNLVDDVHDQFIEQFSASRKLSRKKASSLADGRIFTGRQAKKRGLIDEVGSMQDAITEAKKRAKLKDDAPLIKKDKPSLQDMFNKLGINSFYKSFFNQDVMNSARFGDVKVH